MRFKIIIPLILIQLSTYSQILNPFAIRYQALQKGSIRVISNVSVSCSGCGVTSEVPPSGTGNNNSYYMGYVDIDGNSSTYMSSSDSLALPNCSEVLWAGLYWGAMTGTTTASAQNIANYSNRSKIKIRVNNGGYSTLTADQIYDQNTVNNYKTYHCFKNVTSIVSAAGANARYTLADLVTYNGVSSYGGWSIVIVYKNVFQSMRKLTVYDGLVSVSSNSAGVVNIPISGFVTPQVGPVSFELGLITLDGDRGATGDQLRFNNVLVSDALHNSSNICNSSISYNGILTPHRNPNYNNTLGQDASIIVPNNSTQQYIGNNATSATVSLTSSQDQLFSSVITLAIDVFEPDLRATVYLNDLNGGAVVPGDVLEYTVVGKNIGSDVANGVYIADTLDPRTSYVPGSIQVTHGPNLGSKTDATGDDQAEYIAASKVIRIRAGTGANAVTGGQMLSANSGADSTVVKFRVTVINDCLMFQCDHTLDHKAYIFGTGAISGNPYGNGGSADLYGPNGCPITASSVLSINIAGCPTPEILYTPPICVGQTLSMTTPFSGAANYSWTGPNNFSSSGSNSASISSVTTANSGTYNVHITFPGLDCAIDTFKSVTINPLPTIQLQNLTTVSCFNLANGSISVTGAGTSPFSYSWSNGLSGNSITGLSPGFYTVTVQDANTCTSTATYSITQPTELNAAASITSNFNGMNISCFNAGNGSASVVASGGTTPYSYSWTNGSTGTTASNLGAGITSVTVTDAKGCTKTSSVSLIQPAILEISEITTNVSCFNGGNGAISLSVTGGVAPYTYSWTHGATTQTLSNLTMGNYAVTVTDANGCTKSKTITINQPLSALSISEVHTNILCIGNSTGAVNISVSGGTSPYSYSWSNGATSEDLSNIPAGTYSVTVTDAKLCTTALSVTLTQPLTALSVTTSSVNVLCFGNATGSINATTTGGTGGYTFLWNNGATTEDLSSIAAGTYTLTAKDANNCTFTIPAIVISQPSAALSPTYSAINVSCHGGADASINLSVTGGTAPYTYSWSNGSTTEDLSGLTVGNYTVVVTDAHNCTSTLNVPITQPLAPLALSQLHSDILCYGNLTGWIDLSVTGGTSPYTYAWASGQVTQDIAAIASGNYSVVVTDGKSCSASLSVTLTQPSAPLLATFTKVNVSCFGNATGAIDVTVSGGTTPYTYLWSTGATTQDLSGLVAGTFSLVITDATNCTFSTGPIAVTQPVAPLQVSSTVDDVDCFNGSDGAIDLTVTGGTSPYSYTWSTGATTQDLSGIIKGIYSVVVTDAKGCTASLSDTVTQPLDSISLSATKIDVLCFGNNTGSIDASVSGGTGAYMYSWSNGQTTQDIDSLLAGSYKLVVKDAKLCSDSITILISQPLSPLTLSATHTDALCIGGTQGTIDLTVVGGTVPYTYSWNNSETTQDIQNLYNGTYFCTVTDNHGCSDTISQIILDPSNTMVLSVARTNVSCFGGSTGAVDLTVTGGAPTYTYTWSNGQSTQDIAGLSIGTYSVDVVDANSCGAFISSTITQPPLPVSATGNTTDVRCFNFPTGAIDLTPAGGVAPYTYLWSSGQTTQDVSGILAGNYSVQITDSNGCVYTYSTTVTQPATAVSITEVHTNVNCFAGSDGSIDITPAGGVGNFTYLWSTTSTNQDISGLTLGNYTVTVTDSNACTAQLSVTITQPLAALALSKVLSAVSCFSGSNGGIDVTVTGGTTAYSYLWSNGTTTEDLSGVPIGIYSVHVTDANGCKDSISGQITQPTVLALSISTTPVICHGDSTGTATVVATGGTPTYSYSWSNGATTALNSGISAGSYMVHVTDSKACVDSISVVVNQPTLLTATSTHTNNLCYGNALGSATVTGNGGIPPYTYLWNTDQSTATITNLVAGTYHVVVTDANNCFVKDSSIIGQPLAPLSDTLVITHNTCFNGSTGEIDLTIAGGTAPYSYLWSSSQTTQDITNLTAGIYTVQVKDHHNCVLNSSATVLQPSQLSIQNVVISPIRCFGGNDGAISLTAAGGVGGYSYSWNTTDTTEDISNLVSGNYSLIITDSNDCARAFNFTLTQPTKLTATYTSTQPLCFGYSDGSLTAIPSGGTAPYSHHWMNGITTPLNAFIPAGTYSDTIKDAQGCVLVLPCVLNQPNQIKVSFKASDTVGCNPQLIKFVNTSDEQFLCFWSFGDGNVITGNSNIQNTYLLPGCYDVSLVVQSPIGCMNNVTYPNYVCINPTPTAGISATPTTLDSANPFTTVTNTSSGASSYVWNMGDNSSDKFYFQPGLYEYPMYTRDKFTIVLTAISNKGCVDSTFFDILFDNELILYVPNSFTPDGNEYNNTFKPVLTSRVTDYELRIYNRWGEMLFETYDKEIGWDGNFNGSLVQDGVYVWEIKLKTDGTKTYLKRGTVTMLR